MVEEEELSRRSKEISGITKSINELAVLFKDLSVLVVEQGTILDRIDYNVKEAKEHMEQADVHLQKTVEIEQSGRARGCIYTLTFFIFVCLILLFLKWQ
jgi:syntaxin 16